MRLDNLYNLSNLRENIVKQKAASLQVSLKTEFGFNTDSSQPVRKRMRTLMNSMSVRKLMDKARKLAFHNFSNYVITQFR